MCFFRRNIGQNVWLTFFTCPKQGLQFSEESYFLDCYTEIGISVVVGDWKSHVFTTQIWKPQHLGALRVRLKWCYFYRGVHAHHILRIMVRVRVTYD